MKRKLVVIDEGLLVSMARDQRFTREFPFLTSLGKAELGGSSCCNRKSSGRQTVLNAAKRTIAGLDSGKKRKLRELLNAQQARVLYQDGSGKPQNLTF